MMSFIKGAVVGIFLIVSAFFWVLAMTYAETEARQTNTMSGVLAALIAIAIILSQMLEVLRTLI